MASIWCLCFIQCTGWNVEINTFYFKEDIDDISSVGIYTQNQIKIK